MRQFRVFVLAALMLAACSAFFASPVAAVTVNSGYSVSTHAIVTDPQRLAFDPLGVLYVGRDAAGSGGSGVAAVPIHRVSVGGSPVVTWGAGLQPDPDAVAFDALGFSGVAGSVLVGGSTDGTALIGQINAIRPNQSEVTLFGPTPSFRNPNGMGFDSTGRLLFVDGQGQRVFQSSGAAPAVLVAPVGTALNTLAIGAGDLIYVGGADGVVRAYASNGSLLNGAYLTGLANALMDFGPGNGFGTDLYLGTQDGILRRSDGPGSTTIIGTGFGTISDVMFGPDGRMYVSSSSDDQIYVVTAIPEPPTFVLAGLALAVAATARRWRPGRANRQTRAPRT